MVQFLKNCTFFKSLEHFRSIDHGHFQIRSVVFIQKLHFLKKSQNFKQGQTLYFFVTYVTLCSNLSVHYPPFPYIPRHLLTFSCIIIIIMFKMFKFIFNSH